MQVYKYSKRYTVGFSLIFTMGFVIGLIMVYSGKMSGLILMLISVALFFTLSKVSVAIITTSNYIKKTVFSKEEICYWEWIYAINTDKSSTTGIYTTILRWSKFNPDERKAYLLTSNACNENIGNMLITSHVAEYRQLLKEIVSHCGSANLDETTSKLLT